MKQCPESPALADSDLSGHVWIQERPTGGTFRFQVASSGLVTFATPARSFDTVESVPVQFRRAAGLIHERLDLAALQAATDTPDEVTFCGLATWNEGVAYDWDAVPAFVGVDVWAGHNDRFLPPDAATGVYERLGLPTLPAIDKEVAVAHTDFSRFHDESGFPQSAWRDGPAAGVLVRDKSGGRAAAWCRDRDSRPTSESRAAAELAAEYATPERIERTVTELRANAHSLTVDTIRDRLVADTARESYADLFADGTFVASLSAFRSAVAERVQQHQSGAD